MSVLNFKTQLLSSPLLYSDLVTHLISLQGVPNADRAMDGLRELYVEASGINSALILSGYLTPSTDITVVTADFVKRHAYISTELFKHQGFSGKTAFGGLV